MCPTAGYGFLVDLLHVRVFVQEVRQRLLVSDGVADCGVFQLYYNFPVAGGALLEFVSACLTDLEDLFEYLVMFIGQAFVDVQVWLESNTGTHKVIFKGLVY